MKEVNKDELKRRIKSCLYGLNYSVNEQFFKKTLLVMLEYIEQEEAEQMKREDSL